MLAWTLPVAGETLQPRSSWDKVRLELLGLGVILLLFWLQCVFEPRGEKMWQGKPEDCSSSSRSSLEQPREHLCGQPVVFLHLQQLEWVDIERENQIFTCPVMVPSCVTRLTFICSARRVFRYFLQENYDDAQWSWWGYLIRAILTE